MQSLMRRGTGLAGRQNLNLVESKLTTINGVSSTGSCSSIIDRVAGGSNGSVVGGGNSLVCSNASLNIKLGAQTECLASCSCYRCSPLGMMMKKIHTPSVSQQPKVVLGVQTGCQASCSCCRCAPSGMLTKKLHTSSFLQQPKVVLGMHRGGHVSCSCSRCSPSGTLMRKIHTLSVFHRPKVVLGVQIGCQSTCRCDSCSLSQMPMRNIHNSSGFQQQKVMLGVQTGCQDPCSCHKCSPSGIPSGFQQPKAVNTVNKRCMATVSSPVEAPTHHSPTSSSDIYPRIKFKRLDKTAGHIMQILNREAEAEVRAQREIPEIRPGYIVEVKVVVPENKRRVSIMKGIIIAIRKCGVHTTFRLRRLVAGVGIESLFPLYSPNIKEIKVIEKRKVRRAKLYYLRDRMNPLKK